MKECNNDYVTMFDQFYTTNHIQILKALLPYIKLEPSSKLPVIIKYMELQHTIAITNAKQLPNYPDRATSKSHSNTDFSFMGITFEQLEDIHHAVSAYLEPHEEQRIQEILGLSKTIAQFQEMQQMMSIFKELTPETEDGNPNLNDIISLLQNFSL